MVNVSFVKRLAVLCYHIEKMQTIGEIFEKCDFLALLYIFSALMRRAGCWSYGSRKQVVCHEFFVNSGEKAGIEQ